jgi:diadenosine tetraphosphate (Ap4A) HIT family hydrolase
VSGSCLLCRGRLGDPKLFRVQVWEDDLWRLSTTLLGEVAGLSYLEPKRHVRFIHELDGVEAATIGMALARSTAAIKAVTGAEVVYVYIFGGSLDHLHVHLAPFHEGGPLDDHMLKGETEERRLDSGVVVVTSNEFPLRPESEMREVAERLAARLATGAAPRR